MIKKFDGKSRKAPRAGKTENEPSEVCEFFRNSIAAILDIGSECNKSVNISRP